MANRLTFSQKMSSNFHHFNLSINDSHSEKYKSDFLSLTPTNSKEKSASTNCLNNLNKVMIRIYCKERPPVGIPVIEHLELNVAPLLIKLTNRFYKTMIDYFFESTAQQQTNVSTVNSKSSTLHRNMYRHSSNTDEQFSKILGTSSSAILANASTSPNAFKTNTLNITTAATTSISANPMTPAPTTNASGISTLSTGDSLLIQSPNSFKSLFNHSKKPSQSSITNNTVLSLIKGSQTQQSAQSNQQTNSTNDSNQLQIEDIEIMKQRSANNQTFLCIKITDIKMMVSYKGGDKEKNLKDLNNVCLLFPLFEVHDKTWTWLDLINALKSHVKKALLSQAIKHKIKIPIQPTKLKNMRRKRSSTHNLNDMDEQVTILKLFGTKLIEKKSQFQQQNSTPLLAVMNDSQINISNKQQQQDEDEKQTHLVKYTDYLELKTLTKS